MNNSDIIKVLESDFLEIEEKFKILESRAVNIDNTLISAILDSDIALDLQMSLIRYIKEYKDFKIQNFLKNDSGNLVKKTKIKNEKTTVNNKTKTRDDIAKELNESKATRPLTEEEFNKIISILKFGVKYKDKRGASRRIEPNLQVALILSVQATIGFRINDILRMKLKDIRGNKLAFIEQKTKKLQYRKVNINFIEALQDYAINNNLGLDDYLFNTTARNIQMRLKKVTEYLGYNYIGTHSFRKFYAVNAYRASNNNLEMVRNLLNHSSVSVTQRYINVDQDKIDEYSASVNFVR
ncbi:tyrosine-type recombinase/integrase [Clostridium mediterraneense]|uniref:tyrosine-type recombinase/integrase n=1 Tax=Clostridium mediterraneense TaxID=1805472 RepID=UPI0009FC6D01|nr:tyrosine-type recombinase/integrase [Clostridium mediterraneense]